MFHTANTLYSELQTTLNLIDTQIDSVREDIEKTFDGEKSAYEVMDSNGNYILTPLLVARANLLAGMATLRANADAETRARKASGRR